ncbi:hypothetical protein CTM76_03630 [Photobacterium phosphoreum]|uniref:hypothetical protein n=1 Tax=Photobacterium phosphoreum TaxID=659 RepID=UPI0007F91BD3|nr:hypothetical protein [Photobacterium phosphoreum]OBU34870.1 hypothetical protein AYY25_19935 [Photobacterium phosphoreum]PSU80364.1 hypothetical protein CTM76_03630 [Photobacterium phosphoreum]
MNNKEILLKKIDIEKCISDGLLKRYGNSKSKYIVLKGFDVLPKEFGIVARTAETKHDKSGVRHLIVTL